MIRYALIKQKNPREIVLLRGKGCSWKQCAFCDYHSDFSLDTAANTSLNSETLAKITGVYGKLEIINSGSFTDLDRQTLELIKSTCNAHNIHTLHFECHWNHRRAIADLKKNFAGINVKVKTGVETFDYNLRENILHKGINEQDPSIIASFFDECCLLFGLTGQNFSSMMRDIETGLEYFERICINIMQANSTAIQPDPEVIKIFKEQILADFCNEPRIDILLQNTDFGVGEQ